MKEVSSLDARSVITVEDDSGTSTCGGMVGLGIPLSSRKSTKLGEVDELDSTIRFKLVHTGLTRLVS